MNENGEAQMLELSQCVSVAFLLDVFLYKMSYNKQAALVFFCFSWQLRVHLVFSKKIFFNLVVINKCWYLVLSQVSVHKSALLRFRLIARWSASRIAACLKEKCICSRVLCCFLRIHRFFKSVFIAQLR